MMRSKTRGSCKKATRGRSTVLAFAAAQLAGCAPQGESFLTPGGPVAQAQLSHFFAIAGISLIAILPVLILTPLLVWRYRRGGKGRYAPDWDFSRTLEIAMWGVPVLIVAVLATQLVRNTLALDPYRPIAAGVEPLRVEVVALNWKWLFILPDRGIATVDELAVPVGVPVVFRLTSDSVMQSFRVSALAGQIYVMPGMETRQTLVAERPGVFAGRNTQYNGTGFARQTFSLKAVPRAEFDAWVTRVRVDALPLNRRNYAILAAPSTTANAALALEVEDNATIRFAPVPAHFFDTIVHSYMLPRAILPADQPGAPGYVDRSLATAPRDTGARSAGVTP